MYRACTLYTVLTILTLTIINEVNCFGQAYTYTYTRTNTGCIGQWTDADCWVVTTSDNSTSCSETIQAYPPKTFSPTCETHIVINGDVTCNENATTWGGSLSSITISEGSDVTFTNSITVSDNSVMDFIIQGDDTSLNTGTSLTFGKNVSVDVDIEGNSSSINIGTNLIYQNSANVDITVSGDNSTINVTGNSRFEKFADINLLFEGLNSSYNVTGNFNMYDDANFGVSSTYRDSYGDIVNFVNVQGDLIMGGRSVLSIDDNSGFDIEGTTSVQTPANSEANTAIIDVDGIFYTKSIYINGNTYLTFFVEEDAEVRASEPGGTLDMNGTNSHLIFNGDFHEGGTANGESYIDVGGAITTNGSGAYIEADDATIFTCSTFDPKFNRVKDHEGKFEEGNCRILPVVWLDIDAEFNHQKSQPKISWATAKEWESSHFIIERAVNDISQFEQVGKINAIGWAQTVTTYTFYDPVTFPAGARLYYRLKQVNLDESHDYSQVVSLRVENSRKAKWTAFPNPTNGNHLSLLLPAGEVDYSENITIKIFTPGQFSSIISRTIAPNHSINLNEVINKAPKGLLILEINQANRINRIKILNR